MEVSIAAESLFHIGGFPVTNTLIMTLIVSVLVMMAAFALQGRLQPVPRGLQNGAEALIEAIWGFTLDIMQDKKLAHAVFPLIATIFIFVLFSNWIGLLPGMGTVGLAHGEHSIIPFIRSGSADLNTTIALSFIVVFSVQFLGIATIGVAKYGRKFFVSPFHKPYLVGSFVGLLELLSEVTRMISFSFRLFGNVFAGEVLLIVMLHLVPYALPIPFLIIEVFVGFVQAAVFALLSLVFIKMATLEAEH
ncbi:MAG: F0F1 ATP synthase subunit A [Candidatus Moranbacteria bacterium]|nr:F0F1 ATP synthase subunit A [Candidatus Moranbacteria bacterium]